MQLSNIYILFLFLISESNYILVSRNKIIQQSDSEYCYCKGHRLYGRIQVVDKFPDLKIQVVTSFPDLKVKTVDYNPSQCGEWRMVDKFPELKIQIVNSFPDLKIQFVQSFPGRTSSKLK